jgi:myo-inositol-1(or 4)-monophosphatase
MSADPIDGFLAFAGMLADSAAHVTLQHFREGGAVTDKSSNAIFDPVTEADREAEAAMRRLIRDRYPDHGILGEEHGNEPGTSAYIWIIDPIDGTRSFIAGLPLWTTLIALNDGTRPILGVIDQPYLGERFTGSIKGKAELRTRDSARALRTRSAVTRLKDAVFSTTSTEFFESAAEKRVLERLVTGARLVRFGCDCYGYGLLAAGFIDVVVEAGLQTWDVQPLLPIVEAAGGAVATWEGGPAQQGGRIVAAANAALLAEVLALIKSTISAPR